MVRFLRCGSLLLALAGCADLQYTCSYLAPPDAFAQHDAGHPFFDLHWTLEREEGRLSRGQSRPFFVRVRPSGREAAFRVRLEGVKAYPFQVTSRRGQGADLALLLEPALSAKALHDNAVAWYRPRRVAAE